MKKVTINFFCIICSFVLLLSFAACSNKSDNSSDKKTEPSVSKDVSDNGDNKKEGQKKENKEVVQEEKNKEVETDIPEEENRENKDGDSEEKENDSVPNTVRDEIKDEPDFEEIITDVEEKFKEDVKTDYKDVGEYIEENKNELIRNFNTLFKTFSGHTCGCNLTAVGSDVVVDCTINDLDDVTEEQKQKIENKYISVKPILEAKIKSVQKDFPTLQNVIFNFFDKDGDNIISITVSGE